MNKKKKKYNLAVHSFIIIFLLLLFFIYIIFFVMKKDNTHFNQIVEQSTYNIENVLDSGKFNMDYKNGNSNFYLIGAKNDEQANNILNSKIKKDCGIGAYRRVIDGLDFFVLSSNSTINTKNYSLESAIRYSFDYFIKELIVFQDNNWIMNYSSVVFEEQQNNWTYHAIGIDKELDFKIDIYCYMNENGTFTFAMTKINNSF